MNAEVFCFAFLSCLGSGFGLLGLFFSEERNCLFFRGWIFGSELVCFPGSLARMIHSTLLKNAQTFFVSFVGIQEISAVFISTVGYCTHTP